MPRRKIQTKKLRRSPRRAFVDAPPIDLSSNLPNEGPTEPATDLPSDPSNDLPTDHPADLSENQAKDAPPTDLSSNLPNEGPTEPATDLPSDPSNDLPTDHPADLSENQAKDLSMSSSRKADLELFAKTRALHTQPTPSTDPFKDPSQRYPVLEGRYIDYIRGISITPVNLSRFTKSRAFDFHDSIYPNGEDISRLVGSFFKTVDWFCFDMLDREDGEPLDDDEIDRVQQLFDDFGQVDPDFPPRMVAERLRNLDFRKSATERILSWALITNIAVDGDIKYTLLPHRVLALYRDLDRDSELAARQIRPEIEGTKLIDDGCVGTDAHRCLFNRWVQLTFGLLAGGHDAHQVSAETVQRSDRIRQFIIKLIRPYCVQHRDEPTFSDRLDLILQWAVATGYHLMGVPERYRWDWTWQKPFNPKALCTEIVGKPPPRRPREEEVPEGMWVIVPALVKETSSVNGDQLKIEVTMSEIKQCDLVATLIDENFDAVDHQAEWDKLAEQLRKEK